VPAAAVIPAPVAYVKVAAVKKLVVGCLALVGMVCGGCWGGEGFVFRDESFASLFFTACTVFFPASHSVVFLAGSLGSRSKKAHYFEKIRVFKAGDFRQEKQGF